MLIGVVMSIFSMIMLAYIVVSFIIYGKMTPGYYTIVTLQVFFGGIVMLSIGVIAEYISLIVDQVSKKPNFVIRKFD